MPSVRYQHRPELLASEVIDGEALIIRFDTGAYYSTTGAGAIAWTLLEDGATRDEVVAHWGDHFDAPSGELGEAADGLLRSLYEERLIVEASDAAASAPASRDREVAPDEDKRTFERPVLERFTDVADLLMSDPIHEVEERGWPHTLDAN